MAGKKPPDDDNNKKRLRDVFRAACQRKNKDDRGGQKNAGGMAGARHRLTRAFDQQGKKSAAVTLPQPRKQQRDIGREARDMQADIKRRTLPARKGMTRGKNSF